MTLKAAFVGLGAMGAPMAGHLKSKGLLHAVANRTQAKADALASELGVAAPTLAELAAQCDVIALCVTADADVLANIEAMLPHLKRGAIVVDHSTVSPETAKRAAARLATVGVDFLDAYCNSPLCAPSRFTLVSGQLPSKIGADRKSVV